LSPCERVSTGGSGCQALSQATHLEEVEQHDEQELGPTDVLLCSPTRISNDDRLASDAVQLQHRQLLGLHDGMVVVAEVLHTAMHTVRAPPHLTRPYAGASEVEIIGLPEAKQRPHAEVQSWWGGLGMLNHF